MGMLIDIKVTPAAKAAILTSDAAQAAVNAKTRSVYGAACAEAGKCSPYIGMKCGDRARKRSHGFVYAKARKDSLRRHVAHILIKHI